ncbi:putative PAS/PAC sensor signal transduction histidine kinase [Magnetofaba australis IT-1]|uniref:histidine kinase n=1 Tax=Magnetofaba australis IT-1 TaxID=1434232 RepID=A0A1Y2JZ21_9PROT|nr:putative PAS/PAC sensor signal transduction histidine kinase [Magnetofaba australis IT-1]
MGGVALALLLTWWAWPTWDFHTGLSATLLLAVGLIVAVQQRSAARLAALQRRLQWVEAHGQALLECAEEALISVDAGGRVQYANPAAAALLQRAQEQMVGQTLANLLERCQDETVATGTDSEDVESCSGLLRVLMQTQLLQVGEAHLTKPDGQQWVAEYGVAPITLDGVRIGAALALRDMSGQRQTEEALVTSERRFTSFMNQLPGLAFLKDGDGRYLYVNQQFCQLVGLPLHQILNHRDEEIWSEETRYMLLSHEKLVRQSSQAQQFTETFYPAGEQTPTFWRSHKFPLKLDPGAPVGIGGITIEQTDMVLAQRALEDSQAQLQAVMDNASAVVFLKDLEGRFTLVNRRCLEVMNCTLEQMIGHTDADLFPPGVAAKVRADDKVVLREKRVIEIEEHLRMPDGEERAFMVTKFPLMGPDGEPTGSGGMATDITELMQRMEEMVSFNRQLQERVDRETENNRQKDMMLAHQARLAAMGEMIGNIAHQWRQPLNALNLIIFNIRDAFEADALDSPLLDTQCAHAATLIRQMSGTIDDFRNFFRPDREKQPFNAVTMIQRAIGLVAAGCRQDHIQIEMEAPDEPLMVNGYANEFAQAMLILLANAKDAIIAARSDGGGRIRVVAKRNVEMCAITVTDNGGGVPDEVMERLFEPYFTTKGTKGTGIGLYMARTIIERHMGGFITVSNTEEGAQFQTLAPLCPPDIAE